jgi:hypothetical protein
LDRLISITWRSSIICLAIHSVELLTMETRELRAALSQDGEHIRALLRIAEIHER